MREDNDIDFMFPYIVTIAILTIIIGILETYL